MARISVDELYRGESAGAKYGSGGIMGAADLRCAGGYDEQIWLVKMIIECNTVSAMTGVESLSSYVGRAKSDNA